MRVMGVLAALTLASLTAGGDRVAAMITVAGGPHAGRFLISSEDVPCEINGRQPRQFALTLGRSGASKDSAQLALLMVIIPNANVHEAHHEFYASIAFGDASHGTRYEAETRRGEHDGGSGTITLAKQRQDATVNLDVMSAQGVAFTGDIQCTDVLRD